MAGLYFEQFEVGQRFEHAPRRTVTETDNLLISALTMNPAPLHLDVEYCKGTEFGAPLVNSVFTLGLMVGMSIHDTTVETTVVAKRESRSRPDSGIVTFQHRAFNQRNEEVASCLRAALMLKQPAG